MHEQCQCMQLNVWLLIEIQFENTLGLINEKSRPNSLKEESRSGGRPYYVYNILSRPVARGGGGCAGCVRTPPPPRPKLTLKKAQIRPIRGRLGLAYPNLKKVATCKHCLPKFY